MYKLLACLSILAFTFGVLGQTSVETQINFSFKNLVQKVGNITNAPPRNTTRSMFTAVGLFDVRGKNIASSPDQVQGAQLAFADLNAAAIQMQTGNVFRLLIQDTLAIPQNCLDIVKAAYAEGHRVFIGPTTSEELRAIQSFANDNGLVVISPSSTSADLAQIDNIFRMTASDSYSAAALASYVLKGGYTRVLPVYRNDAFGQGYYNALSQSLALLGVSSTSPVIYDDSMTASSIANLVLQAAGNSANVNVNTAIVLISFNEWAGIIDAASGFPSLQNVLWIGPEFVGTPVTDRVAQYSRTAKVVSVNFYVGQQNTIQLLINAELTAKNIPSVTTDTYLAYDAAMLAGLSFVTERREDSPIYRNSVAFTANMLFGASGRLALNAAGDRGLAEIAFNSLKAKDTWILSAVFDPAAGFLTI